MKEYYHLRITIASDFSFLIEDDRNPRAPHFSADLMSGAIATLELIAEHYSLTPIPKYKDVPFVIVNSFENKRLELLKKDGLESSSPFIRQLSAPPQRKGVIRAVWNKDTSYSTDPPEIQQATEEFDALLHKLGIERIDRGTIEERRKDRHYETGDS